MARKSRQPSAWDVHDAQLRAAIKVFVPGGTSPCGLLRYETSPGGAPIGRLEGTLSADASELAVRVTYGPTGREHEARQVVRVGAPRGASGQPALMCARAWSLACRGWRDSVLYLIPSDSPPVVMCGVCCLRTHPAPPEDPEDKA